MPPLTRTQTLETLQSWWSDRNRPGATMNLHAAAKPLMKLMYHQAVLGFIRDNKEIPLSPTSAEIYLSYLSSKYVSSSTKEGILLHLATRVGKEDEALVVHSHMFPHLLELEDRMDIRFRLFNLCARLAQHHDIAAETCGSLLASLRPVDRHGHDVFWQALRRVTYTSAVGASAAVDARILDDIVEVLKASTPTDGEHLIEVCRTSSDLAWHRSTAVAVVGANVPHYAEELLKLPFPPLTHVYLCRILAYLVLHESTATAVLSMRPCEQLVSLLRVSIRDADNVTAHSVFCTFARMARSPEGAKVVVASAVLDHVPEGIASRDWLAQFSACDLLCKLAGHPSTIPALLRSVPRDVLVALLSDKTATIRDRAAETLRRIHKVLKRKDEVRHNAEAHESG
ncbi:hypothetical protein C8J57DRAFT_1469055 [Mycena rebaudengoi]|nr:hypothetical protein C8J57DRAFT_1469055 [Mycena rebaudengoi]